MGKDGERTRPRTRARAETEVLPATRVASGRQATGSRRCRRRGSARRTPRASARGGTRSRDRQGERSEHVDVGRVGAEQARRHGKARTALQPHLAEQPASQSVGDIVHLAIPPHRAWGGEPSEGWWRGMTGLCQVTPPPAFAGPPPRRASLAGRTELDQSLCGSFSTCQVWPLETSAWRSGVLPLAAAAFCSWTTLSKVGAGSS